jgi:uroporphyrin-III C-methyltransferase
MTAKVYLVGAGPGSAELLTLKAARLLEQADLVLYDALVGEEVLALAPQARKIAVGKRAGKISTDQSFINRLLVTSAKTGLVVVRLKGGDPMIFGRAHEEIAACRNAGIDVEVVPGITAASAAAAHLGVSLTQRSKARSLAFVTPSVAKGKPTDTSWADAIVGGQTTAIYMGASQAELVQTTLLQGGLSASLPVVIARNMGRAEASHTAGRLSDLLDLTANLHDGPSILLVGDVFEDLIDIAIPQQQKRVHQA